MNKNNNIKQRVDCYKLLPLQRARTTMKLPKLALNILKHLYDSITCVSKNCLMSYNLNSLFISFFITEFMHKWCMVKIFKMQPINIDIDLMLSVVAKKSIKGGCTCVWISKRKGQIQAKFVQALSCFDIVYDNLLILIPCYW